MDFDDDDEDINKDLEGTIINPILFFVIFLGIAALFIGGCVYSVFHG